MKRDLLSFGLASLVVLVLFVLNGVMKSEVEGRAVASPAPNSGKDVSYTVSYKRSLRQKITQSPNGILELKGEDVRQILQEPELIRQDLPTVIWQYRTDACVLDLYFTTKTSNVAHAPVVHFETRPRDTKQSDVNVSACLRDLVQPTNFVSLWDADVFYKSSQ